LVTGGTPPRTAAVESYNGTSFTEITDLNTARESHGSCGIQTSALVFGGTTGSVTGVTESWNGTSWTEVADLATTNSSNGFGISSSSSAISMGGFAPTPSTFATITEEFTAPTVNSTLTAS
jgi:hypothetical protein